MSIVYLGRKNLKNEFTLQSHFHVLLFPSSQLFQPLGEMLSYYNENWFSSHHFGFRSSGKLKFGLNTHMI